MAFIGYLVNDREQRRNTAEREISSKWAYAQKVAGPVLVVPYTSVFKNDQGEMNRVREQAYFLPQSLHVNGSLLPEKRHRGIYEAILYRSDLEINGQFSELEPEKLKISRENWLPQQAYLIFGVDDMRGIENNLAVQWKDSLQYFNPGMPENSALKSGVYIPLSLSWDDLQTGTFPFSIHLKLKGSGSLEVLPLGKNTEVHLRSAWPTPSFTGNFLPDKHEVTGKGFDAGWKVSDLNRNIPQRWATGSYDLNTASFGVSLMMPVDVYQKTMRCVKYAILLIALTFIVFFLIETAQNNPVHPFQYILVGFALCIFYTLLLSLSEYIRFNLAYLISMLATVGLVCLYSSWLFRKRKMWVLIGGALLFLYGFIFTLIQLQDFSLLLGSIGLFIVLALLMYYSRKINQPENGMTGTAEYLNK
jgi:inner membrane protein